jgi:hypothetical protein
MTVRHYSDLIAWQRAMDLVVLVYEATESLSRKVNRAPDGGART